MPKDKRLKVLLLEESSVLARLITRKLNSLEHYEVVHASQASKVKIIAQVHKKEPFFLALLDLNLPNPDEEAMVDVLLAQGIPVVVYTSLFSEYLQDFVEVKRVIDYVIRKSRNVAHIVALVERLRKNCLCKVLVVENSLNQRAEIRKLLESHLFQVLEASNGEEAINLLSKQEDIGLVITDYFMPKMDGFELLESIRGDLGRDKNQLPVIAISGNENRRLSIRFIKEGGNDFINRPYLKEEFVCRINQNMDLLEQAYLLRKTAERENLTGLVNRHHFFSLAAPLFNNAKRENLTLTIAMVDIDHFRKVNDTFGHYAGDMVLKAVARVLYDSFRSTDLVTRFGGEEFCILAANMDPESLSRIFNSARERVSDLEIRFGSQIIRVTVSMGITSHRADTLEEMLRQADSLLRQAKTRGRNRIVVG